MGAIKENMTGEEINAQHDMKYHTFSNEFEGEIKEFLDYISIAVDEACTEEEAIFMVNIKDQFNSLFLNR